MTPSPVTPTPTTPCLEDATAAFQHGKTLMAWRADDDFFSVYDAFARFQYKIGCEPNLAGAKRKMGYLVGDPYRFRLKPFTLTRELREHHTARIRLAREARQNGMTRYAIGYLLEARAFGRQIAKRLQEIAAAKQAA